MAKCGAMTKKGKPCPIEADRMDADLIGLWWCHVHDPHGLFRQQVTNKRRDKGPKRCQSCGQIIPPKVYPPTPGLDATLRLSPDAGRTP
jgi:hypothetical protein